MKHVRVKELVFCLVFAGAMVSATETFASIRACCLPCNGGCVQVGSHDPPIHGEDVCDELGGVVDPQFTKCSNVTCPVEVCCGDGQLDDGEDCDDGNNIDGDGCSAECTFEPFCGDGNLDDGEECDDGNNIDGDGCSANCTTEEDFAGCTPGFWKQPHHLDYWVGPNASFNNRRRLSALTGATQQLPAEAGSC